MLPTLLLLFALSFSPIFVHANENQKEDLMKIVSRFMPSNASLISPENPSSTLPIQLYDFDHDGQKEIIFTFKIKSKSQPSPFQFGLIVLKKDNADWRKVWETKIQRVNLDFSGLEDITGDGTKEYLFGVTIGVAAGKELEIYQWVDNSFKKIADVPYHKMDFVNEKQKVGIAIWQMYVGDSYLVDVLKWNGEKLVYNEELYSKYYPIIDKFYKDKLQKLMPGFTGIALQMPKLKQINLKKLLTSIQNGISLAKKLSMQEVVQDFNDLTEKLENKRNETKASSTNGGLYL